MKSIVELANEVAVLLRKQKPFKDSLQRILKKEVPFDQWSETGSAIAKELNRRSQLTRARKKALKQEKALPIESPAQVSFEPQVTPTVTQKKTYVQMLLF